MTLTRQYIIAAIALLGLATPAMADTNLLTAEAGWTKVTTLPTSDVDLAKYYYVIVDNSNDLMLTIAKGNHNSTKWYSLSLWYQNSVSPTTSRVLSKLWTLERNSYTGNGYALKNVEYPARLLQTEWDKGYLIETKSPL